MAGEHRYRGKHMLVGFFLGAICLQGLFHQTRAYPYTLGNSNGEGITSQIEEAERNYQEAEDFVEWNSSENNLKQQPTVQEESSAKNEDENVLVEEILPEIFDLDSLDILKNAPELLRNFGDEPSTDSNIKGVIYGVLDDGDLEEWHNSFQYVSYREARQAVDPDQSSTATEAPTSTTTTTTQAPPSNETTPAPIPETTTPDAASLVIGKAADYYSDYVDSAPTPTYQPAPATAAPTYPSNPAPAEYSNKEYSSGSTNAGYEASKPGYGPPSGSNYEYVLCKIAGKEETVKCPLKGKCAPVLPYDKDCTGKHLEKCPLGPTCVSETASTLCEKNHDCKGSPYKFCVLKETASCAPGSICSTVTSLCVDLSVKKDNYESVLTVIKESTSDYDKNKDYTPPSTSYTKDYPKEPSKSYEKEDYKPPSNSYTKEYPKEPSKSYEKEDYKPPSNAYPKEYPKEPSKSYEKEEKYPSPTKSYPKKKKKTKKVVKEKKYPKPPTKEYKEEKYPAPEPYPKPSSEYPEKEKPYPAPAPSKYPDSYPEKKPDYDDHETYPEKDYESKPDGYPEKEYKPKPDSYPEKPYGSKPDSYPEKPYGSKPDSYGSSNNVYSGNTKEAALKRIKRLYKICKIGGIETLCLIKEDCVKVVAYNSDCLVNPKVACKTYKPACTIRGGTTCKNFQCPNYGKCLDVENLDCKDYCTLGDGYKTVKLGCPPRPFCLPKEPPKRKSSCEKHSHEPGYVYSDEKEYDDYKPTPSPPSYDKYKPTPSPTYSKPEPKPTTPYKPKKVTKPKKVKKPKVPVYKPPAYSSNPMPTETSKEYL